MSVGQRAWPGSSVYAATKTALELLTRSWAVELAPRGVRIVAVVPGAIDTPIGEHQGLTSERMAAVREWQLAHTALGQDRPGGRGVIGVAPRRVERVQISELAKATGATARALRHYEQAGLISSERAPNGYRVYTSGQ